MEGFKWNECFICQKKTPEDLKNPCRANGATSMTLTLLFEKILGEIPANEGNW